jgi:branched-chain amino acid transport system permease protein
MNSWTLILVQTLNGLQLGMMLFLFAAGLTLVLGIMNLVNLAHGSLYMLGAYFAATVYHWTGSFIVALLFALPATFVASIVIELVVLRTLYGRDHLDQVLATFGLILFFNELVRVIWGATPLYISIPPLLRGSVTLLSGINYPIYRLALVLVGLAVALFLYLFVSKTKLGMLIRAGASNREMVETLGVDIRLLFTIIFGLGAVFAALAGIMTSPIFSIESGMGDGILILALVVIVIGGIGSIRGSFVAAIAVGLADTMGRAFLPGLLAAMLPPTIADATGPALASMLIYIVMVAVLFFKPQGLFPIRIGRA